MVVSHILLLVAIAARFGAGVPHRDSRGHSSSLSHLSVVHSLAIYDGGKNGTGGMHHKYDSCLVSKCPPNVVFLLDGSDSLSPTSYRQAQESLAREIRAVTQAFVNTDVGVVLFSDDIQELPLRERSPEQINELISQVENLRQPRLKTSLPVALRRAREILLDYSKSTARAYSGDRGGPVIVLVSDGHPDNEKRTLQEAFQARDRDILIISLYIEPAHHRLLRDIAQVVQEVRTAINWTSLIACPARVLEPVPRGSNCRDFTLVVDGSDSVLLHKETVRQFLAYTCLRYANVTNAIGVNVYGTDPLVQAEDTRIRPTEDKNALVEQIHLRLMFPTTGGTGTDRAIPQSLDMARQGQQGRGSALILITDGPTLDPEATREAIRRTRDNGHPIVIIRVGRAMTDQELNLITNGDQTGVYTVDHFQQLFTLNFDGQLCGPAEVGCVNQCPLNQPRPPRRRCQCFCENTCPGGRLPDPDKDCSCACPNICPVGQVIDPDTCNCECAIERCPDGKRPSTAEQCVCLTCNRRCPATQILDSVNCNCVCTNKCPSGQLPSPNDNCNCPACSNRCPAGQTQNPIDCTCSCPNTCPNQQTPDMSSGCRCACNNLCPDGQRPDPGNNCQCECVNRCPQGLVSRPEDGCSCQCPNSCPSGQTPNINQNCACSCRASCPEATPRNGCVCSSCPLSVCPSEQLLNRNRCTCECPNTCPSGQTLDPNNCICRCPNSCPSGHILDPATCICRCPNTCPSGQILDPATCTCRCPNTCPSGHILDPNSCICRCPNTCPSGQILDPNRCICRCPNTCPSGQTLDPNSCICQCPNTCPSTQILDPNSCICRCPNTCPSGQILDPNRCICRCPNTCPSGQILDPNRCICRCPNTCPSGQTLDPNSCICRCPNTCSSAQILDPNGCICRCPNTCPSGQTLDLNSCSCRCPNTCPSGQILDPNSCICQCPDVCPAGQTPNINQNCACSCRASCPEATPRNGCECSSCPLSVCPSGQLLNRNRCTCECPNTCPSGQIFDQNSCICRCPNTCPSGQILDPNGCICRCPNTCSSGQILDPNGCICRCPNTCPSGQILDPNGCICRCPNTCPSGQILDPNSCICRCPNTCPSGQILDPNSCICRCPNTCPSGQTLDPATCNCQCPNTCPPGHILDPATCNCRCPNTCPPGQILDPATCICRCPNTCPPGQILDPATCICRCPNTCPPGQILDPATCICRCPNTCPPGQILDPATCICRCPNTCPSGQTPDANCVCPRQLECPPGQRLNADGICAPQCRNTCPPGQTANPENSCSCGCPNTCPSGQSPNINAGCTCQCATNPCTDPTTRQNPVTCECECPNPRLSFNTGTRRCNEEPRTCTQTCPPNALLTPDCSCVCPLGTIFDEASRTCAPPEVRGECRELSCNNNQIAYRDCNDRCFCACSRGFAGSRCEIRLEPELCNNCFYDNGHYHASVVDYCDLFVMCIPAVREKKIRRPQSFVPYIMSCPPGTYYISRSDGWRGCDHLRNGRCSSDRCGTLPANARYANPSACQSFWQCGPDQRLASKECCPAGTRFDESSSQCVADPSCAITCGPNRTHGCSGNYNRNTNACPYEVNPANPNVFFYKNSPNTTFHCPSMHIMNTRVCHCVKPEPFVCDAWVRLQFEDRPMNFEDNVPRITVRDGQAANFSGSDDIILKAFAGSGFWTDYFQISVRLQLSGPPPRGQRMAVVTNADCNLEESVSITVDDRNFYFKIIQMNSTESAEIAIPYSGQADQEGWFSLSLLYRQVNRGEFQLSGTIGRTTETYTGSVGLTTYIGARKCAMHIGQGYRYSGLVGVVDNFEVWRCDPRLRSTSGQSG